MPEADPPHPGGALSSRRVLVVEDESGDRMILWRLFQKLDKRLHLEFTGTLSEARRYLAHQPFHGAILDNSLPDGKGVDLALEIARDPRTKALPLYILSGWPSPFMAEKAEQARVRKVFNKHEFGARQAHQILVAILYNGGAAALPQPRTGTG